MDYLDYKYNKYSKKIINFNQIGGVDKSSPFILYIIGEESNSKLQRSYLCTFLFQINFLKRYCNITNDRIVLIYGNNGNELNKHTCEHTKAGIMSDHPIPYGINTYYIDDSYSQYTLSMVINTILYAKINPNTPLIFIYDGHGYVTPPENEGEMILRNGINIDINLFYNIFKKHDTNNKLCLLTQCGSYGFYSNLIKSNKDTINNIVYICSTKDICQSGFGAGILVKLSNLIDKNPKKYVTFNDLKSDLTEYFINDHNSIRIKNILLNYIDKPVLNTGNIIKLKTDNNQYLGYSDDISKNIRKPVQNNNISQWVIEIKGDVVFFKTMGQYYNTYTSTLENGYLDIYNITPNIDNLYLWNKTSNNTSWFVINNDMTVSPYLNKNTFLIYDEVKNIFTHNNVETSLNNKIKII